MLFCPIQQELDCINGCGRILGKIKFNGFTDEYTFHLADESIVLTNLEKSSIADRLSGLGSGKYSIPMQDDD